MFRKPASKPVPVAPMTVAILNNLMAKTPYFFGVSSKGNLTFFARYGWPSNGGHTCPRSEVENYMQYVCKVTLEETLDRIFTAIARGTIVTTTTAAQA